MRYLSKLKREIYDFIKEGVVEYGIIGGIRDFKNFLQENKKKAIAGILTGYVLNEINILHDVASNLGIPFFQFLKYHVNWPMYLRSYVEQIIVKGKNSLSINIIHPIHCHFMGALLYSSLILLILYNIYGKEGIVNMIRSGKVFGNSRVETDST